jgi:aryl-alcohol dehydrogenase-like predicted oxidoreductase
MQLIFLRARGPPPGRGRDTRAEHAYDQRVAGWLSGDELRIGLGCMRVEPALLQPTVAAALAAGITVFDTAHAYGERPGDNERLVAQALRGTRARVVTKGGMIRAGTAWVPDGRAAAIRQHCEASLAALDGIGIDLYLLHAPDPRVPWLTSVRALARLLDEGLVPRVGVSNVSRGQLDAALAVVPVAAVQVAVSRFDDAAVRGGVVRRCEEQGITVLAHSPLGGPRRVRRAEAQESLAWVLARSPAVVAIPGARSPAAVRSAVAALDLAPPADPAGPARRPSGAEVVLVMGIPGAGKSRLAADLGGHERLNRDDRGGSLAALARELDRRLGDGARRLALDNTYLTRASRNLVVETADRHGARVRCVWLDTPLAQAQVNLVLRQLDRFGRLPEPQELRDLAPKHPGLMAPTAQLRAARQLEPPADDEGFTALERVPFRRDPAPAGPGRPGVFVAADAVPGYQAGDPSVPHLVFGWHVPAGVALPGAVVASCPHPGGPPACWCRPPLPGLVLAFCRDHGVDPARSVLVGTSSGHRALAAAVGARFTRIG